MIGSPHKRLLGFVLFLASALACQVSGQHEFGRAERVAEGVELYRLADPTLLEPPGPISVHLLKLDPQRVQLRSALARDAIVGTETVLDMARRHGAVAAINAGLFAAAGYPTGVLKLGGELVSDTRRKRGAVAVLSDAADGSTRLAFDRVSAVVRMEIEGESKTESVPINGVNTTRALGGLMLFTPRYYRDTDTAATGTEWVLRGSPLRVVERHDGAGRTAIPEDGFVLSFGGRDPPAPLDQLVPGRKVRLVSDFETNLGTDPALWEEASEIIGGAGLLVFNGRMVENWSGEGLPASFINDRHPRTIIGVEENGAIWLVTVDGRQPDGSVGMNFSELQNLARRLGLRDALNLDGGGSTTMVLHGRVANRPSDATGPRPVSDALLVFTRRAS